MMNRTGVDEDYSFGGRELMIWRKRYVDFRIEKDKDNVDFPGRIGCLQLLRTVYNDVP